MSPTNGLLEGKKSPEDLNKGNLINTERDFQNKPGESGTVEQIQLKASKY